MSFRGPAHSPRHVITARRDTSRLQELLKRGLMVRAAEAFRLRDHCAFDERSLHEPARGFESGIEINRRDDGFVSIRQKRRLESPAGFLFSPAETQMLP